MRSTAIVSVLTGALLTSTASSAEQVMTAGDLQQLCVGTDHVSVNVCRVYILGVTEGITLGMNMAAGRTQGGRPCVPKDISGDALELALKKRLAALTSPADLDGDASRFIGAALAAAFPCREPSR
jgi:Ssp1 endopeptidase immunity protein Rap1a